MQTHPCEHHQRFKRTFTNDNELGFSPIRQYAHDDVGSFSSMCEEALSDTILLPTANQKSSLQSKLTVANPRYSKPKYIKLDNAVQHRVSTPDLFLLSYFVRLDSCGSSYSSN